MTSNLQKLTKSLQNYTDNKSFNSVIFSVNAYEELTTNEALQAYVSEGIKCFVKYEKCYYKYTKDGWEKDKLYEYSDNPPNDINMIWYPKSKPIASTQEEQITFETLLRTIETLESRIDLLEARVKYLEENGTSGGGSSGGDSPSEDTISTAIMINADSPLMIDENTVLLFSKNSTSTTTDDNITNALMIDNKNPLKINSDEIFLIK